MRPTPPPEAATWRSDRRIAEIQSAVDRQRGTPLEPMHWVNADEPEECTWGAIDCTGLMGRAPGMITPTWSHWLATHGLTPSFLEYRRLIKLLIWRNPLPPGGHLVLKSRQNSRNIAQFAAAFPEARFALTHRDPFRAFTSVCTLIEGVLGPPPASLPTFGQDHASFLARPAIAAYCSQFNIEPEITWLTGT